MDENQEKSDDRFGPMILDKIKKIKNYKKIEKKKL